MVEKRYHSLDGLRAVMMLLGIVLHASVNYAQTPVVQEYYFFKDSDVSPVMDVLVMLIHLFRIPVFFVMTGFFACMLYYRRGPQRMLENRKDRIIIPFAFFWPLMTGLMILVVLGATHFLEYGSWGVDVGLLEKYPTEGLVSFGTMHLWFLYYLMIYVVLTMPICFVMEKQPEVREFFYRLSDQVFKGYWGLLWLIVPLAVLGLVGRGGMLNADMSFLPSPLSVAYYGTFYIVGWYLYHHLDAVDRFRGNAWGYVAVALAATTCYLGLLIARANVGDVAGVLMRPLLALLASLSIVMFIPGLIGLFERYFSGYSPVMRYITDASYWVYLVHLVFILLFAVLIHNWNVGPFIKFFVVIIAASAVSFGSYHLMVRRTGIGVLLNGRKY